MTGYSESVKRLWNEWQLSVLVLSSLLLQLALILTAHRRKIKANRVWRIFYWLTYLGSTYVATYCLGIISQDSSKYKVTDPNMQLQAFWASILLFHLGGQDNFTALTLEDNQLWLRHAAELFLQAATTVYIFIRYLPEGGYRGLLLPFILIFLAAFLKCFGRVWALGQGSMEGLRESMLGKAEPGPDYADTMDRYVDKLRSGVPPLLNINEESRQAPFMPDKPEPGSEYTIDRDGKSRSGLRPPPNNKVPSWQAKSMVEDPNPPEQDMINKEPQQLSTSNAGDANPSVPVPTAVTVDDNTTHNFPLQSFTTSSQSMQPSFSSIYISDSFPTASEFFLRPKDMEQTELARQKSSRSVSSSSVNSFNTNSSTPHGSIGHPSLAAELKVDGMTQHHHSTPDPSSPSSSSTHLCSTEIQIVVEEPQPPDSPQNSSQNPSSSATSRPLHQCPRENMCNVIHTAYVLFSTFKGVLVDGIFSFKEREWSQKKFLDRSWQWAFNVIETELSFAYDVLYTKASISRTSVKEAETKSRTSVEKKRTISRTGARGGAIRVLSLVLTVSTVLLFASHAVRIDEFLFQYICVTYVLLAGAVFVDAMTLLQFIWSDWSFVDGNRHTKRKFVSDARWSNLMSQYNLISFCLKDRPSTSKKILSKLGLKESWDRHRYTRLVRVDDPLKQFLFTELRKKAQAAKKSKDYEQFINCRGDWVLKKENRLHELGWSVRRDFDESLIIWHIATDLCHRSVKPSTGPSTVNEFAVMAKKLSDYMLYLLVMRPLMLSPSTIMGTKRFRDTCAEVKKYFERYASYPDERTAYAMLLQVETPLHPMTVKGDRSKSILWDGCILAKELGLVEPKTRWKIVCKVWVEMLCYAGMQCEGYYHAERLRAGGELLTFACFLMTHLGMGKHYKIEIGDANPDFWTDGQLIVHT
ncbi:uncharacterized protein [Elaeis guineensis]|uniref:uncharacterized protein n=1 Tax=Elaeis guineensis var. tenera TaxID=51953 RepID=UPI00057A10CF